LIRSTKIASLSLLCLLLTRIGIGRPSTASAAGTSIDVSRPPLGSCMVSSAATEWSGEWHAYRDGVVAPDVVARAAFPATFDTADTWDPGAAAGTPGAPMLLAARATIVVQRAGAVTFAVGADDGYRLRIDGREVLADWTDHVYSSPRTYREQMVPGVYALELDYYQAGGSARLSFAVDSDVTTWHEAGACEGASIEPPDARYFVYAADGEPREAALNRFGVSASHAGHLPAVLDGPVAILGARSQEPSPKVILIQGLDSWSQCADDADGGGETLARKVASLSRGLQSAYAAMNREPSPLESHDIIGFSYSGEYRECASPAGETYAESDHPIAPVWLRDGDGAPAAGRVVRIYEQRDTCPGVSPAADRLDALVRRLIAVEPQAPIILVGHSMGGLVAAHYLGAVADEEVKPHIKSVIAVDAPLWGGAPLSPFSTCAPDTQAWRDVSGGPSAGIVSLASTPAIAKLFTVNTTFVGDTLPPARNYTAACGALGGGAARSVANGPDFWRDPIGWLTGVVAAAAAAFEASHGCAFHDAEALAAMARVVFNQPEAVVAVAASHRAVP